MCYESSEGCRAAFLIPAGNKSFDCLDEQADNGELCDFAPCRALAAQSRRSPPSEMSAPQRFRLG